MQLYKNSCLWINSSPGLGIVSTFSIAAFDSIATSCTSFLHNVIKDILSFERIQRRTTKHILSNYNISYKSRLLELHLLTLMYSFEIQDVLFAIKSLKSPTRNFDINRYIMFIQGHTKSSTHKKLKHHLHTNN